jgi:hypothetical protein
VAGSCGHGKMFGFHNMLGNSQVLKGLVTEWVGGWVGE